MDSTIISFTKEEYKSRMGTIIGVTAGTTLAITGSALLLDKDSTPIKYSLLGFITAGLLLVGVAVLSRQIDKQNMKP